MSWQEVLGKGPSRHVWRVIKATWLRAAETNLSGLAAGSAFYAFLSIFPALSAVVSIYGLVVDPGIVERQIEGIDGLLPANTVAFLRTWLHDMAAGTALQFGIGLAASLLLALWSAASATRMLMAAVNVCYGESEKRGFILFNLRALLLTVSLGTLTVAALGLIAAVPETLGWLPIPREWVQRVALIRWPMLAAIAILALDIVYRYAPYRHRPRWIWLSWGALAATALWLVTAVGFQYYVVTFGSYDRTYGSLGAVVVLLLWLYWGAYAALIGAALNAEIQRRRAR